VAFNLSSLSVAPCKSNGAGYTLSRQVTSATDARATVGGPGGKLCVTGSRRLGGGQGRIDNYYGSGKNLTGNITKSTVVGDRARDGERAPN
jgi:hypothetical protein